MEAERCFVRVRRALCCTLPRATSAGEEEGREGGPKNQNPAKSCRVCGARDTDQSTTIRDSSDVWIDLTNSGSTWTPFTLCEDEEVAALGMWGRSNGGSDSAGKMRARGVM